ncbi:MAG: hypothetical protein SXG53_22840 [Pseudomonadota bacterium]|nr:hypothetical protein [Pseudomonadota bacterium]
MTAAPRVESIELAGEAVRELFVSKSERARLHLALASNVLHQIERGHRPSRRMLTAARDGIAEMQDVFR